MARMKLAYDDVRAINPKIIYCGMFGFGQDGRYRDKPAYDTIIQGSGGMAALHHRATGEPRFVPMVVADKVVGLIAVQMIAMALYGRSAHRRGLLDRDPDVREPGRSSCWKSTCTSRPSCRRSARPAIRGCSIPSASRSPPGTAGSAFRPTPTTQAFAFFDAIGRPELKTDPRFSTRPGALRPCGGVLPDPHRRAEGEDHRRVA